MQYDCRVTCKVRIGDLTIDLMTELQCIDFLYEKYQTRTSTRLHLLNVNGLTLNMLDLKFHENLIRANLLIPDGMPIIWFCKDAEHDHMPIRGSNLLTHVLSDSRFSEAQHLFLGGKKEKIAEMRLRIESRALSGINFEIRPLPFSDTTSLLESIVNMNIDFDLYHFIWIGIGTPKQDYLASTLCERSKSIVIPIGAVFGFLSGEILEAPRFIQYSGFEWLYRLYKEPRRLLVRYMRSNFIFLLRFGLQLVSARFSRFRQTAKGKIKNI